MADTFKKVVVETPVSSAEDGWKDIKFEREHQPVKQKSDTTYRNMEAQIERIDNNITTLTKQKTDLEAEMVKVKTIAEA